MTAAAHGGASAAAPPAAPRAALAIVLLAALLRLAHLAAALRSPTSWNPGPDEDFYLQFARHVASGAGLPVDFRFMDPLYGWLVGGLFALTGESLFALYLLQAALDTLTVVLLWRCGVALGRPRAGLLAALAYGLCPTALMFSTATLKATWVAAVVTLWSWLALRALAAPSARRWLMLGLLGGLAVGLRSNLLLLAGGALVLLPWLARVTGAAPRTALAAFAWLAGGTLIGLAPWSALNMRAGLGPAPLPYNGGIVLHHLYNDANPEARSTYPAFVAYRHPLEIWRGYRAEAERRAGRPLSPPQVSGYWRAQALDWIARHPARVARSMARKLGELIAWPEIPNNRAFHQEREFSPVLRWLPAPFPWLLALGLPGLVLLLREDRRAPALWLPLAVCVATAMVFFAEDRFRFHAVPTLALGSGLMLERAWQWLRTRRMRPLAAFAVVAAGLSLVSHALARQQPPARLETSRVAWGWLRMGEAARASSTAQQALARGERDAALHEVLAALALREGRHADAVPALRASLALRPAAHGTRARLAESLAVLGDTPAAIAEWRHAVAIQAAAEYREALAAALAAQGEREEAIALYRELVADADADRASRARIALATLTAAGDPPRESDP